MKYNITSANDIDSCIEVNTEVRNHFVFVFGYEQRSAYLAKQLLNRISNGELIPIPFIFNDYKKCPYIDELITELKNLGVEPIPVTYQDGNKILDIVTNSLDCSLCNNIYVDYSSMPRSWYSRFPKLITCSQKNVSSVVFWYAKGQYKAENDKFPNTCVQDEIEVFSGRATLRPLNERSHIFCLGYDSIRTHAIISVIDPSYYGVAIASPTDHPNIRETVIDRNTKLIGPASFQLELPIEDFNFMVSKLSDISNNLLSKGDVILVPDGPKPLIMACSMVPDILEKHGVVCLHVKRHKDLYEPVDVTATGEVYGFILSKNTYDC